MPIRLFSYISFQKLITRKEQPKSSDYYIVPSQYLLAFTNVFGCGKTETNLEITDHFYIHVEFGGSQTTVNENRGRIHGELTDQLSSDLLLAIIIFSCMCFQSICTNVSL